MFHYDLEQQEIALKAIETYYSDNFKRLTPEEMVIIPQIIDKIIDNIKEINDIWKQL